MSYKSNPWNNLRCMRDDCGFCERPVEKVWSKCYTRGIVYESQCMTCLIESQRKFKAVNKKLKENNPNLMENNREFTTGNKRPRELKVMKEEIKDGGKSKEKIVKYVGETSRSGYERSKEHFDDFDKITKEATYYVTT